MILVNEHGFIESFRPGSGCTGCSDTPIPIGATISAARYEEEKLGVTIMAALIHLLSKYSKKNRPRQKFYINLNLRPSENTTEWLPDTNFMKFTSEKKNLSMILGSRLPVESITSTEKMNLFKNWRLWTEPLHTYNFLQYPKCFECMSSTGHRGTSFPPFINTTTDVLDGPQAEPRAPFVPTHEQKFLGYNFSSMLRATPILVQVHFQVVLVSPLQPFPEPSDK